jgi:hypothetical protein
MISSSPPGCELASAGTVVAQAIAVNAEIFGAITAISDLLYERDPVRD